ncbi:MAG: hypothetical protein V1703_00375 [Candidatus Altiarchaeota archaeon]
MGFIVTNQQHARLLARELKEIPLRDVQGEALNAPPKVEREINAGGFLTYHNHTVVGGCVLKIYGQGKVIPTPYTLREAEALCDATRQYNEILKASGISVPNLRVHRPIRYGKTARFYALELLQDMIGDGKSVMDRVRQSDVPAGEVLRLNHELLTATYKAANYAGAGRPNAPFNGSLTLAINGLTYRLEPPFNASVGIDNKPQNVILDEHGKAFFVDPYPPFQLNKEGSFVVDEILRRKIKKDSPFDLFYWHMCDKRLLYCKPHLLIMMARPELRQKLERQVIEFTREHEHPLVAAAVEQEIKEGYPLASHSLDVLDGAIVIPPLQTRASRRM